MVMTGMAQQGNNSDANDDLDPRLDPHVDWIELRVNPKEKAYIDKKDLADKKNAIPNAPSEIGDAALQILNNEQHLAVDIVNQQLDTGQQIFTAITDGPGTVIKAVTKVATNPIGNQDSVLRLGTTGTATFLYRSMHAILSYNYLYIKLLLN